MRPEFAVFEKTLPERRVAFDERVEGFADSFALDDSFGFVSSLTQVGEKANAHLWLRHTRGTSASDISLAS